MPDVPILCPVNYARMYSILQHGANLRSSSAGLGRRKKGEEGYITSTVPICPHGLAVHIGNQHMCAERLPIGQYGEFSVVGTSGVRDVGAEFGVIIAFGCPCSLGPYSRGRNSAKVCMIHATTFATLQGDI